MQILASDKSESSIADDMDITPADYAKQNRRKVSDKQTLSDTSANDIEPEKMIIPSITQDSSDSAIQAPRGGTASLDRELDMML